MAWFIALFAVLFICCLADFSKSEKIKQFAFWVSLLCCIFLCGFRNMGSGDFVVYEDHYNKKFEHSWEIGYLIFEAISQYLNLSYYGFILLTSICVLTIVFFSLKKYSPYPQLSILIYVSMYLLLYNMGAIRQGMAVAIFIYSLRYIKQEKLIKYTIAIAIAFLFHKSVIICYPLYFIVKYLPLNPSKFIILFFASFFIGTIKLSSWSKFFEYIGLDFISQRLEYYIDIENNGGSWITQFLKHYAPAILIMYFYNKSKPNSYLRMFMKISLIHTITFAFAQKWAIAWRFWVYYELAYIFLYPLIIKEMFISRINKLMLYVFFVIFAGIIFFKFINDFDEEIFKEYNLYFIEKSTIKESYRIK